MAQYLQQDNSGAYAQEPDRRYPEVYHQVMPYIEQALAVHGGVENLDEAQLGALADQIARDSGVLRSLPQGHTRETVKDMIKVLLLQMSDDGGEAVEAMGPLLPLALGAGLAGAAYAPYPYPYPYYYGPGPYYYGRPGPYGPGPGRRR